MATFRERLADHRGDVFLNTDHYAETVSYTPSGDNGTDISAVVQRSGLEWREQHDGGAEVETAIVRVSAADVSPTRKDTIATTEPDASIATWGIDGWEYEDGMWMLQCVKISEAEITGAGHRTRRH